MFKYLDHSGALSEVDVGADGTVYGIKSVDQELWKYDESNFVQVPTKIDQISVGNKDNVWGLYNPSG
ncbi:MAG: tectonin domain-containing protein [Candidatus Nitrosocosmicus sp.]